MQQAKVPRVVSKEYPSLLRCHEQLSVVGRPRQADLPGRPHGVPGRLQTRRDCPGNVVVEVQVGQRRLPRRRHRVHGDLCVDDGLMLLVVGYRRFDSL